MAKTKKPPDATRIQANKYDKIIKENLVKAIPDLMYLFTGMAIVEIHPENVEMHHTKEKKADFLATVTVADAQKSVLHIEFQVENDSEMLDRMYDYRGFLRRRHPKIRILQYVIFLGESTPKMETQINEPDLFYRYHLLWMQDINYHHLLKSENPELVVMAMLADFENYAPELVAEQIIEKLQQQSESELDFLRFTNQLRMLANIRNLRPLIDEFMEKISRFFVPERDPWYNKGVEKGIEKGFKKGLLLAEIKLTEATLNFVVNLILKSDHNDEFIGSVCGATTEAVHQIRETIRLHPDDFREKIKGIQILPE